MRKLAFALAAVALWFAVPANAGAAVSVGHSGWAWGNPQPQGNVIRAVEFSGARGYAAGEFGTLLRSDDAGATWTGLSTGVTAELRRVRIVGTDTVIVSGVCSVRRSDNAGATFRRINVVNESRCTSSIASFFFTNGNTGYFVLANGQVFSTSDGGTTFSPKTSVPIPGSGAAATDIWFTSDTTGFATVGDQIYRTTDGAGSWTLVASGGSTLNGIYFVDGTTGYAVGSNQLVLRTTDGGATWQPRPLTGAPGGLNLTSMRCGSATTCVATTESGNELLRTTDGGENAAAVTPATQKIFGAAFASPTRVVAGGFGGATVVSDDAAQNFTTIGVKLTGNYSGLKSAGGSTAFAFGESGALARSTNGGETWASIAAPTDEDLVDVTFPTAETGFALDASGQLRRTDNGGASWRILDTGTGARPRAVVALSKEKILLIGPAGIRISTNGGEEFNSVANRVVRRASLMDADRVGKTVFVWSGRFLAVSTNGTTWKRLLRPSRFALDRVDFVTAKRGYALDVDGRVWSTSNQGRRWTELLGLATGDGYDMAWSDAQRGWVTIDTFGDFAEAGLVMRTSNAGKTWRPQLIGHAPLQKRGLVAVGSVGLGLANQVSFFTAKNGGDQGTASSLTLRTARRVLRGVATIKVSGRLSPAEGGERVTVSRRQIGSNRWESRVVTVAANGSFTTSWRVRKTSWFVAQYLGDDDHTADGSPVLRVQRGALPKPGRPVP